MDVSGSAIVFFWQTTKARAFVRKFPIHGAVIGVWGRASSRIDLVLKVAAAMRMPSGLESCSRGREDSDRLVAVHSSERSRVRLPNFFLGFHRRLIEPLPYTFGNLGFLFQSEDHVSQLLVVLWQVEAGRVKDRIEVIACFAKRLVGLRDSADEFALVIFQFRFLFVGNLKVRSGRARRPCTWARASNSSATSSSR